MYVSRRRDTGSARTFSTAALTGHDDPGEVITERAPALANAIEALIPAALHNTGQYENNRVECDHGRLKGRLQVAKDWQHQNRERPDLTNHAKSRKPRLTCS